VLLSARGPDALRALAGRLARHLADHPDLPPEAVAATLATGRARFDHRLATAAATTGELSRTLEAFARGDTAPGLLTGHGRQRPRLAFLFSGQGGQRPALGRALHATEPLFRRALEEAVAALEPHLDRPLLPLLLEDDPDTARLLDHTTYTQPVLFALQVALAQLWRSWGLEPDAVLGHSSGEIAAAWATGTLSLEDAAALVAHRARLLGDLPPDGSTPNESPLDESRLDELEAVARGLDHRPPRIPLVSTLLARPLELRDLGPAYWRRQARETVRFAPALAALQGLDLRAFLEIGPTPDLVAPGRRDAGGPGGGGDDRLWLPSLRPGHDDRRALVDALVRLLAAGAPFHGQTFFHHPPRRLHLPTYPFEGERFWIDPPITAPVERRPGEAATGHPLLGRRLRSPLPVVQFETELSVARLPLVRDHRIHGLPWVNFVIYLEMGLAAAARELGGGPLTLEEVAVRQGLVLPAEGGRTVQLVLDPPDGDTVAWRVFSLGETPGTDGPGPRWTLHARGRARRTGATDPARRDPPVLVRERCGETVDPEAFYQDLAAHGGRLGLACRRLAALWRRDGEALGLLTPVAGDPAADPAHHLPLSAVDASFQLISAALPAGSPRDLLLIGLERLRVHGRLPDGAMWARAVLREDPGEKAGAGTADLELLDEEGRVWVELQGARVERVGLATETRAAGADAATPHPASLPGTALAAVLATTGVERPARLEGYLREALSHSLGLPAERIDPQAPLLGLLDSLMAVELQTRIRGDLGVELPVAAFFDGTHLRQVAERLHLALGGPELDDTALARLLDEVDALSDAEAEALLAGYPPGTGSPEGDG
jgi:acyl transferase domain-containing protein